MRSFDRVLGEVESVVRAVLAVGRAIVLPQIHRLGGVKRGRKVEGS